MSRLKFLKVGDVATLLGCSPNWVSKLVRDGHIKAYRLSHRGWYRIRIDSLEEYARKLDITLDYALLDKKLEDNVEVASH